jgi:broad specificity phosphatase PhoE
MEQTNRFAIDLQLQNPVILVRHGETFNNSLQLTQDNYLDLDILQSEHDRIAKIWSNIELSANCEIITSNTKRAISTARIINASQRYSIVQNDLLNEVDFGIFSSRPEHYKDSHGNDMQYYRKQIMLNEWYSYDNGDNKMIIDTRIEQLAKLIIISCIQDKQLVLVGHNRLFRHLLVRLGILQRSEMFDRKLPHGEPILIDHIKL